MQATDLKFPGGYTHAKTIRREVAHTISQLEDAKVYGTPDPAFAAFLADAASKTPGYVPPTVDPLPPTKVVVTNGDAVKITDSNDLPAVDGTVQVAAGAVTNVKITAASATILVNARADIKVAPFGSTTLLAGNGVARVANGEVSRIELPTGVAPVVSGLHSVAATGTGTKVTFTVAAGVITAITLSE